MIELLVPRERTTQISVCMIWLFHISGALGILYGDREFFLQTTPINLFFTLVLLFANLKNPDRRMGWAAILAFTLGMLVEILGVNYGLIFGTYSYGENLGVKVLGVPVLIVLIDLVIEPVAPIFDYWTFSEHVAPLSNYVGWFLVALPIQLGIQYWIREKEYTFSAHLVLVHFLFFGVFALQ